jgi:beta-galactosidase
MIELHQQTFLLHGKPTILRVGEMHYFRIPKELWETHMVAMKDAHCNAISTYVPWLIHEPVMDTYEFNGESVDQYDLIYFLTLCQKHQLPLFFRPGPFVMAELYMEGVASYLESFPELKPYTFHHKKVPNDQLDYMHPIFLDRCKKYFDQLFQAVKPFFQEHGGPIFGIQIDNEIGMLAWVSQSPPLTHDIIMNLKEHFNQETYTFNIGHEAIGHQILGQLLRERYQSYVSYLKGIIQSYSKDMLTFINVHGTGGGRGLMFPIGYSQLLNTFKGHIIGTDTYFMDLDFKNAHDYYMINSQLNALKDPETPATCLEFNGGNSDFGHNLYHHDTVHSMDKKIRLNMIQNHKMINYYLFSAGLNPLTHSSYQTGNRRIALTGEGHGFSAPLKLDGSKTYMYHQISKTNKLIKTHQEVLSKSYEVHSNVTVGLMLDQFMTENMRHQTGIETMKVNLTKHREGIFHEVFLKHALFLQYNPSTLHLEPLKTIDVLRYPILAVATSAYMSSHIQQLLLNYVRNGGKLMCFGELPVYNLYGEEDTSLIEAFNITVIKTHDDHTENQFSVTYDQYIDGFKSFRTPYAQSMNHEALSIFHTLDGHKTSYITDQVMFITNMYPADLSITKRIGNIMGIKPVLEAELNGYAYLLKTTSEKGSFIHILNFESYPLEVSIKELPFNVIHIPAYDNVMLPINLEIEHMNITSTSELIEYHPSHMIFKTSHQRHEIKIQTHLKIDSPYCQKTMDGYECLIPNHGDTETVINF